MKKKMKDKCTEYSIVLGSYLNKLFNEMDLDLLKIKEDKDSIYYVSPKFKCFITKNKHSMKLKGQL